MGYQIFLTVGIGQLREPDLNEYVNPTQDELLLAASQHFEDSLTPISGKSLPPSDKNVDGRTQEAPQTQHRDEQN